MKSRGTAHRGRHAGSGSRGRSPSRGTFSGFIALLLCLLHLAVPTAFAAENLIVNPGFEKMEEDLPQGWWSFVLPHEGALGRVDSRAHSGANAVLLHTALPYENDPSNNWSQNLRGDYAGKTMRLGGWVRTEEASGAALWLQCWKQNPLRRLATSSTSTDKPLSGTGDWQEVATTLTVPAGTEFITVRCVLQGVGSAWFDDLSLTEEAAAQPAAAPAATAAAPPRQAPPAETPPVAKPEAPKPAPAPAIQPATPAADANMERVSHQLNAVRDANEYLGQTVDDLRSENQHLLEELDKVRHELKDLNQKVNAPPPAPKRRAPPLVPHGVDWEKEE